MVLVSQVNYSTRCHILAEDCFSGCLQVLGLTTSFQAKSLRTLMTLACLLGDMTPVESFAEHGLDDGLAADVQRHGLAI